MISGSNGLSAIKVLERRNFGKEVATAESGKEDLRKRVAVGRK
jgi:hypothetical protein